jgi:transaldolase / glucose-6-phosphate isomerase
VASTDLGPLQADVGDATERALGLVERIWDRDHTVWQDDPTEVADRLGWLDCPTGFADAVPTLSTFADRAVGEGITDVLLVGMGGSSLYPEVLAQVHGPAEGHPRLHVLDSTAPAAVTRVHEGLDWSSTLLVAASKSGTTTETRSHLAYFSEVLRRQVGVEQAGRRTVAITDPGSQLATLGRDQGFREVFTNPADIGGRFSALSYFGLVPASLLGLDLATHLGAAARMADRARRRGTDEDGPVRLGAAMAVAAAAGRDKLTVVLPEDLAPFGLWIEQLVAESTGKQGKGILPVVGEPLLAPDAYGDDRLFVVLGDSGGVDALVDAGHPVVRLARDDEAAIPAEVFRWEFATAVAGALLDLNPFDQPDVQAAKTATARVLEEGTDLPGPTSAGDLLGRVGPGDYVALLAFVDPDGEVAGRLVDVADALRERLGVPVTVGLGPRYLHSTGQLHKGGPDEGVFLVTVGDHPDGVEVPGEPYDFATLIRAQAAGDLEALGSAGRRAGLVTTDELLALA